MTPLPKEPIGKGAILLASFACAFALLSITVQAGESAGQPAHAPAPDDIAP